MSLQSLAAQALRLLRGPHRQPEEGRPAPMQALRLLPAEPGSQAGGFSSSLPPPHFPPAPSVRRAPPWNIYSGLPWLPQSTGQMLPPPGSLP